MGFLMYLYLLATPVVILGLPSPFVNRANYGLTFRAVGDMQFVTDKWLHLFRICLPQVPTFKITSLRPCATWSHHTIHKGCLHLADHAQTKMHMPRLSQRSSMILQLSIEDSTTDSIGLSVIFLLEGTDVFG